MHIWHVERCCCTYERFFYLGISSCANADDCEVFADVFVPFVIVVRCYVGYNHEIGHFCGMIIATGVNGGDGYRTYAR